MGGLGGGGYEPPVISTSTVEPNPLVFARIAIVAATLDRAWPQRGLLRAPMPQPACNLSSRHWNALAILSARLAEIAREEVAGEPVSHEDLYWLQENLQPRSMDSPVHYRRMDTRTP